MKAIRTRYSGPTNTRGSRIHATDGDGNRATVSYSHGSRDMHELAAYSLMRKMGWSNPLIGGGFGNDNYWVMVPMEDPSAVPAYIAYFESTEDAK